MILQESDVDRLVQAAVAALTARQVDQAAALLDQALGADPCHLMALAKRAEVAMLRQDHVYALRLTESALEIEPCLAPAWHQRAGALWAGGRPAEAVAAARRAVDIQPPNPEFRFRLAQFAAWTGRDAEAQDVLHPLLEAKRHDPTLYAAAIAALGEAAVAAGRFAEAAAYLDQALAIQPNLAVTRMMRGMNLLRLGRYREGWIDYAAREGILGLYPDQAEVLADDVWQGQDLTGKTLLVTDDQGHGDAIQFFRYLPMLHERGAAVTWRSFQPLIALLANAAPHGAVVAGLPEGAYFDFQCNSTSLPRVFGTELDTIPAPVLYLTPPERSEREWGLLPGHRLKVGLVWSGDARHTRDHLRSVPASLVLRLMDVPGVSFHSLQHEIREADLPAVEAHPALGRAVETAADFADTAALIARLDLVIAVDTAIAHLAGALGKPVWLILHVAPDWRWLTDRSDSPWYPRFRLFRVTPEEARDGLGWVPVVDRVRTALQALAIEHKDRRGAKAIPSPRQAGIMRPRGRPAKR